ncbi:MAG: 50S ribosomal protein L18 [Candidatus Yanofskybacteria bacterium RIFCSPHIGHO2_02_FULL_41_29]|uniref:Large ribosomal subunit protein uL18 n=1 Tax=Candidatus Yanofskybacteria bacterium RIFCSPHIGHO2_01_FULL_41_53 TaxID=1802663 RepID=A0A1F8EJX6_9BACT|nr:MAG: 50S ribosomal protein L18 [Candidatus Yanofskybacteria bacterium RIFCSPHIGHO2_01_FULL_41_53]OGN11586.1 MAG: 50S ribosomal protein L18 [Candidatus Yanofskybacteria bacterium RIFCSPHIGHO2_02_FULL_41_29]OGN18841.1 MAG: 50S ribosomal protein L18 [Candidatus Yanofskybacteria bacterium RIFCSPHIGHO2_12_FULL_41_9]OGN22823.1 MAG: 50S ribosomal protein L18 [Candidatus Yanofskybacteria bacterium RIFCSPLOWO2_01_FULL_41_67]OGN30090.1 MAG: 50S ribosomal protein L18 [Candidatus Yanofskybacteria bacter
MKVKIKRENRMRRHNRVRAAVKGTSDRPRVSIFKSNRHVFIQFIDDTARKTILSSKITPAKKSKIKGTKTEKVVEIAKILAKKAEEAGVKKVVFDRGGYKYHGRIKALADGLRAGGLKF